MYKRQPINYPGLHDYRFYEQMSLNEPYKEDTQTNWSLATDDIIFDGVVMTADETAAYNAVMPDIKTYVETSYMEFIVGDKSLDTDWDAYVETVNLSLIHILDVYKRQVLIVRM